MYSKLIDIGYDCVLPEGAFYLFPKSPIASDEDFVKNLQDNLVLVVPGSGFGKKGYFSKHNTAYWQSKHYLGIGPSAHSYNGKSRNWNISSNKQYIRKMKL